MNLYDAIFDMVGIDATDNHHLVLKTMIDWRGPFTVRDLCGHEHLQHIDDHHLLSITRLFEKSGIICSLEFAHWQRDPFLVSYQNFK